MSEAVLSRSDDGGWRLSGTITNQTVTALLERGDALAAAFDRAQVDLAQVAKFDSAALALLVAWQRQARGTMVLKNVPPRLKEVAKVCGLFGLLGLDGTAG